ncbi:MAG: endolytic transglycosylase MltG [Myxococcota bacterium]
MAKVLKAILVTVVLLALAVGGTAYAGYRKLQGYGDQALSDDKKAAPLRVRIPKGANARQIASALEREGVIKSARQFYWYTRLIKKSDGLLRPGEYDISPGLTPSEIVAKLSKGDVVTYKFTIPEGSNLKDIARIIGASGLAKEEEIVALAYDDEFVKALEVPPAQKHLEGYLFPDTYRFPAGISAKDILRHMRQRMNQALTPEIIEKGKAVGLDPHQILTLASIVEKETGAPQERPKISCVFHNRLREKWKLQTDPTVIYGIQNYAGNITKKDLETPHPYNTYVIPGLPPGPIASPGTAAIHAAVEPEKCPAFFFVSMNNGTHIFCETLQCHEKNVKKWQVEWFKTQRSKGG